MHNVTVKHKSCSENGWQRTLNRVSVCEFRTIICQLMPFSKNRRNNCYITPPLYLRVTDSFVVKSIEIIMNTPERDHWHYVEMLVLSLWTDIKFNEFSFVESCLFLYLFIFKEYCSMLLLLYYNKIRCSLDKKTLH